MAFPQFASWLSSSGTSEPSCLADRYFLRKAPRLAVMLAGTGTANCLPDPVVSLSLPQADSFQQLVHSFTSVRSDISRLDFAISQPDAPGLWAVVNRAIRYCEGASPCRDDVIAERGRLLGPLYIDIRQPHVFVPVQQTSRIRPRARIQWIRCSARVSTGSIHSHRPSNHVPF